MAPSIVAAVATIKRSVADCLTAESIHQACREVGYTWRDRELGPVPTIWAFLLQVLHGNTACAHVVRLARLSCSAAAYCAAAAGRVRAASPTDFAGGATILSRALVARASHVHVDGSGFSMPDTDELRAHFGQPSVQRLGCGFPVARLLAMFDAATGLVVEPL